MPEQTNEETFTHEDMARAWREGWIVGNRWAFTDADADAIETCPYDSTPAESAQVYVHEDSHRRCQRDENGTWRYMGPQECYRQHNEQGQPDA